MGKEDKIKKVIFYNAGNYSCNLRCHYCYLEEYKPSEKKLSNKEQIKLFSKKNLEGIAFFNFVTNGETLLYEKNIELIELLLKEGHVINIVTNLTYSEGVNKIISLPKELSERVIIHASLHYNELKEKNKLQIYFDNIKKLKAANISHHMDLTIAPEYMPILDEIKNSCINNVGILPNITIALDKSNNWMPYKFYDEQTHQIIKKIFEAKELDVLKKFYTATHGKICKAGLWAFSYDNDHGFVIPCNGIHKSLKRHWLTKKIRFKEVGICPHKHCFCGEIFLTWGLIPDLIDIPNYFEFYLKDKGFYNETIKKLTNVKLTNNN